MQGKIKCTPAELAAKGFPTFGRVNGNAVMLEALLENDQFLVRYVGLAALTIGPDVFCVHKAELLDF